MPPKLIPNITPKLLILPPQVPPLPPLFNRLGFVLARRLGPTIVHVRFDDIDGFLQVIDGTLYILQITTKLFPVSTISHWVRTLTIIIVPPELSKPVPDFVAEFLLGRLDVLDLLLLTFPDLLRVITPSALGVVLL
jgi:hypothetical protein